MKSFTTILKLIPCVLIFAPIPLTSCSSEKQNPAVSAAQIVDPAILVKKAAQATEQLDSAHVIIGTNGDNAKLNIQHVDGDLQIKPNVAAQGSFKGRALGQAVDANFVVFDGKAYSNAITGTWMPLGSDKIYDLGTVVSPDKGIPGILNHITNPKNQGIETIDGAAVEKISGTVPAENIAPLFPMVKGKGQIPVTAWIQTQGEHQLAKAAINTSPVGATLELSKFHTKFNITKPN